MAGEDNRINLVIDGKNDAGGAFAQATAEAKALQRAMDSANRASIEGDQASSRAWGNFARSLGQTNRQVLTAETAMEGYRRSIEDAANAIRRLDKVSSDEAQKAESLRVRGGPGEGSLGRLLGNAVGGAGGGLFAGLAGGVLSTITSGLAALTSAGTGTAVMFGGLAAAAVAAFTALFPVTATLLPIAAGFATFAAVAIPSISKVWAAVHGGARAWASLTPAEKQAGDQIKGLQGQFERLTKAVQPMVLQAFTSFLRIVKDLMPALIPLAKAAGKAIDGLLKSIDNWLRSPSGKKFIAWLQRDGPHAIEIFTHALWDLMNAFGRTVSFLFNEGEHMQRTFASNIRSMQHDFTQWGVDVWHVIYQVGQFFGRLPGMIGSALARLPGMLFTIGVNAIQGLLRGLQSMAGGVLSWASGFVSNLVGIMARAAGIGSPSRITRQHGMWLAQGLADGMNAGTPMVAAAAARLGRTAAGGAPGGYGGGPGGGPVHVVLEINTSGAPVDEALLQILRKAIRLRGGNVQLALGRGT